MRRQMDNPKDVIVFERNLEGRKQKTFSHNFPGIFFKHYITTDIFA